MVDAATTGAAVAVAPSRPGASARALRNPGVIAGGIVMVLVVLIGLLAPWLGTIDPTAINPAARNRVPGAEFSIRTDTGERIEPTLSLAFFTIMIAVLVAVPLGVLAAHRQGTWIDRLVMGFSVLGFSLPVFVIGYLLIYVFAIWLNWLPVQGYQHLGEGVLGWAQRLILPSLTLSVIYIALIARMTRASLLEVLSEDYIRTARAKGQIERKVLFRHALRNAAVPIVTVIGLGIALLIGGVVVTESLFTIPGLGRLTVDAVLARDYPTIQAVILLFSFVYVMINLAVDLIYTLLDPRIRY